MEKEKKLKLKLSRFFTSSCKNQDISEAIDHQNPIFTPQTPTPTSTFPITNHQKQISSIMCKPKCPQSFDQMIRQNCIIPTTGNPTPRRKVTGKYHLLSPSGEFPHPKTEQKQGNKKKQKKRTKNYGKIEKSHLRNNPFSLSSSNETEFGDWFSSDDEREDDEQKTEIRFSSLNSLSFSSKSISLSSDSDPCNPTRVRSQPRCRTRPRRDGLGLAGPDGMNNVKDMFAVVKSSSDPYSDFRSSMVEMIVERKISGIKELEELLLCFLTLNSINHHRVIVDVFSDILDALFSSFS